MDLVESLEVRWFLPDGDPALARVRSWFLPTEAEGRRVDHYLVSGRDDLSIKARVVEHHSTRFETKYLLASLGTMTLAPGVVGQVGRWRKLSFTIDDPAFDQNGIWRAVEKSRQLRKFALRDHVACEVPLSSRLQSGCGVELTRVRLQEQPGAYVEWTVGFEAFGSEPSLLDSLRATCRALLDGGMGLEVGSDSSMSYPEWLISSRRRLP